MGASKDDQPVELTNDLGMNRLTLRFAPALESEFFDDYFLKSVVPVRAALFLGAACLLAGVPVAGLLFPAQVAAAQVLMVALALVVLIVGVFTFSRHFKRWMRWSLAAAYVQFVLFPVFLALVRDPELTAIGTLATVILLIYLFTLSRMGFLHAFATSLTLAGAWLAVLLVPGMAPERLLLGYVSTFLSAFAGVVAAGYFLESAVRRDFLQRRMLAAEREKSERLLLNVLPREIADRLKEREENIADSFPDVTVLFADLVGFTTLSGRVSPAVLIDVLNTIFTAFDELAERHGLEKIKTIGDSYMVVGGLPTPSSDHPRAVAEMALDMRDAIARISAERGWDIQVRIGVHTGPVVAGVIGQKKFAYDLWGDTVNTASRMESHGVPGAVQISAETCARLEGAYVVHDRGKIEVKGKGLLRAYLLLSRAPVETETPLGARVAS